MGWRSLSREGCLLEQRWMRNEQKYSPPEVKKKENGRTPLELYTTLCHSRPLKMFPPTSYEQGNWTIFNVVFVSGSSYLSAARKVCVSLPTLLECLRVQFNVTRQVKDLLLDSGCPRGSHPRSRNVRPVEITESYGSPVVVRAPG